MQATNGSLSVFLKRELLSCLNWLEGILFTRFISAGHNVRHEPQSSQRDFFFHVVIVVYFVIIVTLYLLAPVIRILDSGPVRSPVVHKKAKHDIVADIMLCLISKFKNLPIK